MRPFKIHKATHKWFAAPGAIAMAIGQRRGTSLCLNLINSAGQVTDKTMCYGAVDALTGYGAGVAMDDARRVESMRAAWRYTFGPDQPAPAFCEMHKESV